MKPVVGKRLGGSFVGALVSSLSVDDCLSLIDSRISLSTPRGRVTPAIRQTPDGVTLEIEPNDNWQGHHPDQHVLQGVDLDGVRHSRCSFVVSAPSERMIETMIKRNGDGRVSNCLVDHAERGQLVHLSPAEGVFYPQGSARPQALLLSAGSGITSAICEWDNSCPVAHGKHSHNDMHHTSTHISRGGSENSGDMQALWSQLQYRATRPAAR